VVLAGITLGFSRQDRGDYMRDEAEAIDAEYGVEPATPHRTWL